MAKTEGKSTLIAIGGHENKSGNTEVLRIVAERLRTKKIVVATLASSEAEEMWKDYRRVFGDLGLEAVHLNIEHRADGLNERHLQLIDGAGGLFFTGGDQVAITTKMGGTPLCEHIHQLFMKGRLVIAGTSAGASVLSETMLVSGDSDKSHRAKTLLLMSPGLAFISGVVIDQHFAERGRVSRLLGVVAQNPRTLGVGIDENTAVVIRGRCLEVVGDGAVYVIDGRPISHTNLSEQESEKTISVFDVRMHVLSHGDEFDMEDRMPLATQGTGAK